MSGFEFLLGRRPCESSTINRDGGGGKNECTLVTANVFSKWREISIGSAEAMKQYDDLIGVGKRCS
ncbi:hypothetical protein Poly51_62070 [Rubripirellula tenax]|uniref:Uncharacterized protein n=1 Tax=Rubripirellula tenax TaxID=2528015 RepID=A0A5C6E4T3_9BACT|nr:hypothetical protein Poly51_62070 [Rubripirellula tenax]